VDPALLGAPTRFLVSGAINTAATFAIYVQLLGVVTYVLAYSVAFVSGIVVSYLLHRYFVFRTGGGLGVMMLFPLVYVVQYLLGVMIIFLWVDVLDMPETVASVVAVVATVPVTYALSRRLFLRRRDRDDVRP